MTAMCPIPYALWDMDQPVVLLQKGGKSKPTVPLFAVAKDWCRDNLNPGWKAQFINGDPCLVCETPEDVMHFQLRWGNSLGAIKESP